jgi:pimeloyl-ACP methyl ester carboxylesterase
VVACFDGAEDLALLKPSLRDPTNLTAALAITGLRWAASVSILPRRSPSGDVATEPLPYGRADGCIGVEVAEMAAARAPDNLHVAIVDGVGHFLHRERPADIDQRILDHVTG